MDDMNRRDFIKGASVGTLGAFLASGGIASTFLRDRLIPKPAKPTVEIGELKSIHVKCITETSWFDNYVQQQDFKKAGGAGVGERIRTRRGGARSRDCQETGYPV